MHATNFRFRIHNEKDSSIFKFRCKSEICFNSSIQLLHLHDNIDDCITEMISNKGWWLLHDNYIYEYYMHAFMRTLKYANNNNQNKTCWLFNFTRSLEAGIPLPLNTDGLQYANGRKVCRS